MEKTSPRILSPHLSEDSVLELALAIEEQLFASERQMLVLVPPNYDETQIKSDIRVRLNQARFTKDPFPDLVLTTSGSRSSTAHLVGLSWSAVVASAKTTIAFLAQNYSNSLPGPPQWVLALPPHHIAGFQVILRSMIATKEIGAQERTTPVIVNSEKGFTATAFRQATEGLSLTQPNYISLVPTQLRRLLDAQVDLSMFQAILVGGARLDPHLADQGKNLPLVNTYGMTETSGGCVYNQIPLPETELLIQDQRILISGPTLMNGYLDEESPITTIDGRRWLVTNDQGKINSQGKLTVLGRTDDVIISGGENVSPSVVQDLLQRTYPALSGLEIIGLPDQKWGQIVTAAAFGIDLDAATIGPQFYNIAKDQLGKHCAPRVVVCLRQPPLLTNGKIDQKRLVLLVKNEVSKSKLDSSKVWKR